MRYRLMASYQGAPFEAGIGPGDNDVVLFAACPPPEELGFEPATGHWRKELPIQDVQAIWESRPVGVFRGQKCIVLDDLGDRLHIGYVGHDAYEAEQLGYWQVDRGVFELVAGRNEVFDIVEERTEYPARPAPAESAPRAGRRQPTGQMPPGAPQDQAMYLPAELPQDQASYLSGAAGYAPGAGGLDHDAYRDRVQPGQPGLANGADGYDWRDATDAGGYGTAFDPRSPVTGNEPVLDHASGVALPPQPEPPLPLEAAALRAASESRRPRRAAAQRGGAAAGAPARAAAPAKPSASPVESTGLVTAPAELSHPTARPQSAGLTDSGAAAPATTRPSSAGMVDSAARAAMPAKQRRSARRRLATERLFAELAALAGLPVDSYAVGEEVDGAMCLLPTDDGFEVFHSSDGNRHELRFFESEEAACFYLFGVLAAEAVRNGTLRPSAEQLTYSTGPLPTVRTGR